MKLFYSPLYVISAHSFETTRKASWIAESLVREPIPGLVVAAPPSTTAEAIGAVHDGTYVEAVRTGTPRELAESQGFRWDPGLWSMVLASNGGAVAAALEALPGRTVSGSLSSGLHHAHRAHGAGFCTFNGLALAARAALETGANRVLVLDLDAHCGGGTHELVHRDERILQVDVSVDPFDRYSPEGMNRLEMVHDGKAYLATVEKELGRLERETPRFDLCLYNAGVDPFEGCPIGGRRGITRHVIRDRERMVFSWCRARRLPVAFVVAGGYLGPELDREGLVALHRLTLEAACASGDPARGTRRRRSGRNGGGTRIRTGE